MLQLNRAYLDVGEHVETKDFTRLQQDGVRLEELALRLRSHNAEPEFLTYADALSGLAGTIKAAGARQDLEAARRAGFRQLNGPCGSCHRVYRAPSP